MIMASSPFGTSSNDARNHQRNAAYLTQKIDSWTRVRQSQFPPPRIPSQFLPSSSRLLAGGGGNGNNGGMMQPSLGMLCDVAGGVKRPSSTMDNMMMPPKRFKSMTVADMNYNTSKQQQQPPLLKENPILLERISALGGGFPMPKWGMGGGISKGKTASSMSGQQQQQQQEQRVQKVATTGTGAFPMPSVTGRVNNLVEKEPTLSSYKSLWRSTDHDLRREVLSRQLHRGHVKILNETAHRVMEL